MNIPLFTEAELRGFVSQDEAQFLEFKSTWDRSRGIPKEIKRQAVQRTIAETVVVFASADAGLLLVGVEDGDRRWVAATRKTSSRNSERVPEAVDALCLMLY